MTKIRSITGNSVKDSRGDDALVVSVEAGDHTGVFATPSGASTGSHEVEDISLKEGMFQLEEYVAHEIVDMEAEDQNGIDAKLKWLGDKYKLGGDVMIGASVACAKLSASIQGVDTYEYLRILSDIQPSQEVPFLFINMINGGKHATDGGEIQEYWVIPQTQDASEAYSVGKRIQKKMEEFLGEFMIGDEGGFVIQDKSIQERFALLKKASEGEDVRFGIDVAASSFYEDGVYVLDEECLEKEAYLSKIRDIAKMHELYAIEDPFYEEDFESFTALHKDFSGLVIGDDLTVSNIKRLKKAVDRKSINAIIIKPNQIGTLSDTLSTMRYARENNIHCIVSHRSGETEDTFIADLAYAFGCLGLKSGAPGQKERDVKYKCLIEISKQ